MNARVSSTRTLVPLLGVILAIVVTFVPPQHLRGIRSVYWRAMASTSLSTTGQARTVRSWIDILREIRDLHQQNETLKATNLRLQADLDRLQGVEHENEVLRGELGFVQANKTAYDFFPAQIISRSATTFSQTVTINQGARNGVAVDQGVISQGFVVGRVIDVTDQTAQVRLITSSRSKIPIQLGESRATGLLSGGLAGLTGDELPNDVTVIPGESVVTSNLGGAIPAGLPVGTVEKVLSVPSAFVTQVAIHSPIAFSKLETVVVVRSK